MKVELVVSDRSSPRPPQRSDAIYLSQSIGGLSGLRRVNSFEQIAVTICVQAVIEYENILRVAEIRKRKRSLPQTLPFRVEVLNENLRVLCSQGRVGQYMNIPVSAQPNSHRRRHLTHLLRGNECKVRIFHQRKWNLITLVPPRDGNERLKCKSTVHFSSF
jgi:hypothetical protein